MKRRGNLKPATETESDRSGEMTISRYVVKPRQDGRGFDLSGGALPDPVWYLDDVAAVEYAHWHGRGKGGKIHVLDLHGHCIRTETIEGKSQASQYGPQVGEFKTG
jgi:hypothetical protein